MSDNLRLEALFELLELAETSTDPAPILAAIEALLSAGEAAQDVNSEAA